MVRFSFLSLSISISSEENSCSLQPKGGKPGLIAAEVKALWGTNVTCANSPNTVNPDGADYNPDGNAMAKHYATTTQSNIWGGPIGKDYVHDVGR